MEITFHFDLLNGQRPRQTCLLPALNQNKVNKRLAQSKQNLRATCLEGLGTTVVTSWACTIDFPRLTTRLEISP